MIFRAVQESQFMVKGEFYIQIDIFRAAPKYIQFKTLAKSTNFLFRDALKQLFYFGAANGITNFTMEE